MTFSATSKHLSRVPATRSSRHQRTKASGKMAHFSREGEADKKRSSAAETEEADGPSTILAVAPPNRRIVGPMPERGAIMTRVRLGHRRKSRWIRTGSHRETALNAATHAEYAQKSRAILALVFGLTSLLPSGKKTWHTHRAPLWSAKHAHVAPAPFVFSKIMKWYVQN